MGQLVDDLTRLRAEGGLRNAASRYLDDMGYGVEESRQLVAGVENFTTGELASGLSEDQAVIARSAMDHANGVKSQRPAPRATVHTSEPAIPIPAGASAFGPSLFQ